MKLIDLNAQFVRYETRSTESGVPSQYKVHVDVLAEAQGIIFLCPACFAKNGGPIGTHALEVSFAGRGVSDDQGSRNREGGPSRWSASGLDYRDLTTQPSILIDSDSTCPGWHGWITGGQVA